MGKKVTPDLIIKTLVENGYFSRGSYNPAEFCSVVENKLGVGRERALQVLDEAGLAKFEYDPNPTIHPREKADYWRVVLTKKGAEVGESL